MKLSVQSTQYEFTLMSGDRPIGHYTTVLSLLEGARWHLRKDRTKGGQELRAFIENGIRHEASTLEQLKALVPK